MQQPLWANKIRKGLEKAVLVVTAVSALSFPLTSCVYKKSCEQYQENMYNTKIKWDYDKLIEKGGIEIIDKNPDGAELIPQEQDFIEQVSLLAIEHYIGEENLRGRKIRVQKDNQLTLESERHYQIKQGEIESQKKWIIFGRSNFLKVQDKRVGECLILDKDNNCNIDTGRILLGDVNSHLILHEFRHLFIYGEPNEEINKEIFSLAEKIEKLIANQK